VTQQSIVTGCLRLTDDVIWPHPLRQSEIPSTGVRGCRKFGAVSCTECTGQGDDYELIPMLKMETRHSVEGSFGNEFPPSLIIAELWQPEVARRRQKFIFCILLEKTTHYGENFQNSVPREFTAIRIDVLCSNFVKFD